MAYRGDPPSRLSSDTARPTGSDGVDGPNWLGRQDSNLRYTGSKPGALPLGYAPISPVLPPVISGAIAPDAAKLNRPPLI